MRDIINRTVRAKTAEACQNLSDTVYASPLKRSVSVSLCYISEGNITNCMRFTIFPKSAPLVATSVSYEALFPLRSRLRRAL